MEEVREMDVCAIFGPAAKVLMEVKEVRETADPKEIAELISSKEWIGIGAMVLEDGRLFMSLGRI